MSLARIDPPSRRTLLASLGAALFILSLGALDPLTRGAVNLPALIPPFGASTVIVFFAPDSAASRAWSVVVGHLGSALVACAVLLLLPASPLALQAALAVAGAGVWMVLSRSIHPPGGATALLTTLGGQKLGVLPLFLPLLAGCASLVAIRWLLDRSIAWWSEREWSREPLVRPSLPPDGVAE
ncbi:MAG TPA: HPP family protein [Polyangiales bacterium]